MTVQERINAGVYGGLATFFALLFYFGTKSFIQHKLARVRSLQEILLCLGAFVLGVALVVVGVLVLKRSRSLPMLWSLKTTPVFLGSGIAIGIGTVLVFSMLKRIALYLYTLVR
jgi:Na+/phosphate symporter